MPDSVNRSTVVLLSLESLGIYSDPYGTARLNIERIAGRTAFFGVFPVWRRTLTAGYLHIHVGWQPGSGPGRFLYSRN
jgi:hypothetical protein